MTVHITPATEADKPFIYSSWLKSYREAPHNGALPNRVYYRAQTALIDELLDSPTVRVLVARSPVDALIIRGWGCADGPVLHYVYVKSVCRRQGIADALLRELGTLTTYTHAREPYAGVLRRRGLEYDGRLFGGAVVASSG